MSEQAIQSINAAVQDMYEAFPYPDYSLFVPLRWQEAYASGSLFAQGLVRQKLGQNLLPEGRKRILIAGCGDVQAAIISRWEPRLHKMVGVDLSRPSLRKAKLRAFMMLRPMHLYQLNLEDSRVHLGEPYAHIDAYGMLHHLANPSAGLHTLSRSLLPGGTMRIMVYNSRARQWMFHISRVFTLLGLKAYERSDLQESVRLLQTMQRTLPALHDRLEGIKGIIQEPARLVDAFFHEREARLGLSYWLKAIHNAGLKTLGLMDRYAELDDLANPLLTMPTEDQLQTRMDDLRFENNLEFYLYKDAPPPARSNVYAAPLNLRRRMPPLAWQRYAETRKLGLLQSWQLWQAFLTRNFQGEGPFLDRWARNVEPSVLQRLSRLGALFPDQCQSRELQKLLMSPMQSAMEAPQCTEAQSLTNAPELRKQMEGILLRKKLPLNRMQWIEERLKRAQSL